MTRQARTRVRSAILLAAIGIAPEVAAAQCYTVAHTLGDPTPESPGDFGARVAIDGDRMVVAAPLEDVNGHTNVGRVYLHDATSGALLRTFDDPSPTEGGLLIGDAFGAGLAVDGDRVLIGAPGDNGNGLDIGQAHLFDAATGELLLTFDDPTPTIEDLFGASVAIDGSRVIIGAPLDDTLGESVGQAHIFDADTGELLHTLNDPTPTPGLFGGLLGEGVAVEGDLVAVGAAEDDVHGVNVGQVYLFDATTGDLLHTLDDPTPTDADLFGGHVDVNGGVVAIGAPADDTNGPNDGQVHLFDAGTGRLLKTINKPVRMTGALFGLTVSIDAGRVLAGAETVNKVGASGSAYLIDAAAGELLAEFEDPTPDAGDDFARDVDLDGGRILIGGERLNDEVEEPGEAHLFTMPGDFDGDGVKNILDFVAFQGAFVAGDESADCDESGELDIQDFVCFQYLFQEGCE